MDNNKDIFLPDTTVKYGNLKKKLREVYGLDIIEKKTKYIFISVTVILVIALIYKIK